MAGKVIKGNEIIENNALDNAIANGNKLLEVYKALDKTVKKTATNIKTVNTSFKSTVAGDLQRVAAAEKQVTQAIVEGERIKRAKIQTEKSLISLQRTKETQAKREKKTQQDLNSVWVKQRNSLTALNKAYAELDARGRGSGKVARGILAEQQKVRASYEKTSQTLGRGQVFVGQYERALGGLRGTATKLTSTFTKLGLTMGTAFLARNIGGIIVDFSQAQGDLLAISGKTADELATLTAQAKELGETTQFSATQITLMQVELAKLGFTVRQIEQSTKPVSDFAAATGVDLPRAANLAGSALRAFNLEASEMERVVSTLGVATTKSALDFSQLETGLSTVAPVANAFGFSIEETTALLGGLSNAGFDASSSATATRNILLNLADANGDLAKSLGRPVEGLDDLLAGLKQLESDGVDLATTLELTDKRSVAAFNTFLKGTDTIEDLKNSITGANQELKDMAEKRLDTVGGQLTLVKSAWEGFILGADGASGASRTFKNALGFLAKNLSTILGLIIKIGLVWATYKTTMLAVNAATKANLLLTTLRTAGLKSLFTAQTSANTATVAGTTAQKGLNVAMKANPIGLVITALVTLVALLWDFGDATDAAAESQRLLNIEMEKGIELAKQSIGGEQAKLDEFAKKRVKELIDLKKTEEEILKQVGDEYRKNANESVLATNLEIKALKEKLSVINQQKVGQTLDPLTGRLVGGQLPQELKEDAALLNGQIAELEKYQQSIFDLIGSQGNVDDAIQGYIDSYLHKTKGSKGRAGGSGGEDILTGLAKLQKELTDLEKERSDYLVANEGVVDATYIAMTNQTRELKLQIEAYNTILDKTGQIEKAESRSGQITTEAGKTTLATGDVDLTTVTDKEKKPWFTEEELEDIKQVSSKILELSASFINARIDQLDKLDQIEQAKFDAAKSREQEIINMRDVSASKQAESLAYEREQQMIALQEQEKIAKRKMQLALLVAAAETTNNLINSNGGDAVGNVSSLLNVLDDLPAFWTGTETTVGDSLGMKVSDGRDGILARVDKSEMIMNKDKTDTLKQYGLGTTDSVVKSAISYQMGLNDNNNTRITEPRINIDNRAVTSELREVKAELKQLNRKPTSQIDIETLGSIVNMKEEIKSPNKIINKVKRIR